MYIARINSTNTRMREMLARGEWPEGEAFLRAGYQTAGRGQTGNGWESEEGQNLLCSILIKMKDEKLKVKGLFDLNVAVSVATHRLIAKSQELRAKSEAVSIKWPNDIYWGDQKIAGLLIENVIMGNEVQYSIAGIGLNVNQCEWHSDAPNPVSLKQITGKEYDVDQLMQSLYAEVQQALNEEVWDYYKAHLYRREGYWPFVEREVSIEPTMNVQRDKVQGTKVFMARIEAILPTGEIVLQDQQGQQRTYHFKQVRYVL